MRQRSGFLVALGMLLLASPGRATQPPPELRYHLRARLDEATGVVVGTGEIRYRHHGPGPITSLSLSLPYNAFRPGARAWPSKAPVPGADVGFIRIADLTVDGTAGALTWPASPDSSIAVITLSRPLATGDSAIISFAWSSRPPSLAWHRDRAGHRFSLSGWYPLVIDETSGTSVPGPAFGSVLLEFDLPADDVIGGTGVPRCGDPGWARVAALPSTRVTLQRDWYRNPRDPAAANVVCEGAPPGLRRIAWYAEDVTEAAYVLSPSFRYEEGDFAEQPVHALYEGSAERAWGGGLATRRMETALAWVTEMSGRDPWPQITLAPALDSSGRALPMTLLTGQPSQTALLGLLGRMTTEQVMSGGARVFTRGTAAYQAAWFFEALGRRGDYPSLERQVLDWDLDGLASRDEPLVGGTSVSPCQTTLCRRAEFMSYQLRRWAGNDEALKRVYRTLVDSFALRPTEPGAFQRIARQLIQPAPDPLYAQLPVGGVLYDDAIASVRREPIDSARWRTDAVIERRAPGIFPRILWVIADSDTVAIRSAGFASRETLTVITRTRPRRVILDPRAESHDWNMLNNQSDFGFHLGGLSLLPRTPRTRYFDSYFTRRSLRDRLTMGWAPTAAYSDLGGWAFGLRLREDYLGRFELNELAAWLSTGWRTPDGKVQPHATLSFRNPIALRARGWSQGLDLAWAEGRARVGVDAARRFRGRVSDSTWRSLGLSLQWWSVTDPGWLDRRFYDDAGTVELTLAARFERPGGRWPFRLEGTAAGGFGYPNATDPTPSGGYSRLTFTGSIRTPVTKRIMLGVRLFAGAVLASDSIPRQRRIYLAGADPYERFGSPLLRSRGSLFAGSDFFYHVPGGAGVRGLDPRLSADHAIGASLELEYALKDGRNPGEVRGPRFAAFGDAALADGDIGKGDGHLVSVGDLGVGIRTDQRIGHTRFTIRLDLPVWVSRAALAQDDGPGSRWGFRWSASFLPSF